jgi:hypothetical protein
MKAYYNNQQTGGGYPEPISPTGVEEGKTGILTIYMN